MRQQLPLSLSLGMYAVAASIPVLMGDFDLDALGYGLLLFAVGAFLHAAFGRRYGAAIPHDGIAPSPGL
jgi:hypothetical protein